MLEQLNVFLGGCGGKGAKTATALKRWIRVRWKRKALSRWSSVVQKVNEWWTLLLLLLLLLIITQTLFGTIDPTLDPRKQTRSNNLLIELNKIAIRYNDDLVNW